MANNRTALLLQVVIDSTNKYIDINIGAGEVNLSIAESTYDSMYDVVVALDAALSAHDASLSATIDEDGSVIIAYSGSFSVLWKTGTNGSDNTDYHIGTLCGFDDSADDTGASSYTSDNQHMYGYYHAYQLAEDSYDRPKVIGPATFVTNNGTASRVTWGTQTRRNIKLEYIKDDRFFTSDADTNEAFEDFWEEASAGTPFTFFSDTELWTDEGNYTLLAEDNEDMIKGSPRVGPGDPYYSRSLTMVKQS